MEREPILFTVSAEVLAAARKKLLGCDHCTPADAEIPLNPFKALLDEVMAFSGLHTDYYIMEHPLTCPLWV